MKTAKKKMATLVANQMKNNQVKAILGGDGGKGKKKTDHYSVWAI